MRPRNAFLNRTDHLAACCLASAFGLACLALLPARGGVEESDPSDALEIRSTPGDSPDAETEAVASGAEGGPLGGDAAYLPASVGEDDFRDLSASSPFSRSLSLSDSLILTGVAVVDGEQVATLLNKDTKETFVVSSRRNPQGWRMVELSHDADLEKVAAKVAVAGGEVVTVRYAEWQLKPGEAKPGAGPGEGGTITSRRSSTAPPRRGFERGEGGDRGGPRGGPSPEIRERLSQLSDEQRSTLFQRMGELRESNPDMSWEDRGRAMLRMAEQITGQ